MRQLENEWTEYEFSDEELQRIYAEVPFAFIALLKTRRAQLAGERLLLTVDTKDVEAFIQAEAALHGAIDELSALIANVENANFAPG